MGVVLSILGRYEEAIPYCERALKNAKEKDPAAVDHIQENLDSIRIKINNKK